MKLFIIITIIIVLAICILAPQNKAQVETNRIAWYENGTTVAVLSNNGMYYNYRKGYSKKLINTH
jgi:uncharacterized integral membrane protein